MFYNFRIKFTSLACSLLLVFSVSIFPMKSNAIIPFIVYPIAELAVDIAIGQFAATAAATLVNPSSSKTLRIPGVNKRALAVSFAGSVAIAASAALFAKFAGYSSVAGGRTSTKKLCASGKTFLEIIAAKQATYPVGSSYVCKPGNPVNLGEYLCSIPGLSGSVIWYSAAGCSQTVPLSVDQVAWLDYSTNLTQAKANKLITDLRGFSVSNPIAFAKMVTVSAVAAPQVSSSYSLPNGSTVSVSVSPTGVVSGANGNSITLTNKNVVLVSGVSSSGPTGTGAGTGAGAGAGAGSGAGAGAGSGAGSGSSAAIVAAIVASSSQAHSDSSSAQNGVSVAAAQAKVDAKRIADVLLAQKTDCEKFPNSVGCSNLGAFDVTPHNFGNGIVSTDTFSSVFATHNANWKSSAMGSTITRLFPSSGMSGYPVWSITLGGKVLTLDMATYSSFFSMLGSLVLVLAGFQSIKIILGRD